MAIWRPTITVAAITCVMYMVLSWPRVRTNPTFRLTLLQCTLCVALPRCYSADILYTMSMLGTAQSIRALRNPSSLVHRCWLVEKCGTVLKLNRAVGQEQAILSVSRSWEIPRLRQSLQLSTGVPPVVRILFFFLFGLCRRGIHNFFFADVHTRHGYTKARRYLRASSFS